MTLRPLVTVLLALAALSAGCGRDQTASSSSSAESGYVTRVQAVLDPAGHMAALAAAALRPGDASWPQEPEVERTLARSDAAIAALGAFTLAEPALRRQRDRLVAALHAARVSMRRVADDLVHRDRAALRAHAPALFADLQGLPSHV